MPSENLDANGSYSRVFLAVNEDPGARPPSWLDLDRNIVPERQFTLTPTSRVSLEEEDSSTIRCICSYADDDGNTVLCEKCNTWQHIACYYDSAQHVPDIHECVHCLPRAIDSEKANEKQRISRQQLIRGLKRHPRSHSQRISSPVASQPEPTTVNLDHFIKHFGNVPISHLKQVSPSDRAWAAHEFYVLHARQGSDYDKLAKWHALESESEVSYDCTHCTYHMC